MNEPKVFSPEWWIEYELLKIKDENRKRFLREVFSGPQGWQRFKNIRINGKGAKECEEGGAWEQKKTKDPKHRPCLICDFRIIKFTPWNELFEDHLPICLSCIRRLLNTSADETPEALFPYQLPTLIRDNRGDRITLYQLVQYDIQQERDKLVRRIETINQKLKSYGF